MRNAITSTLLSIYGTSSEIDVRSDEKGYEAVVLVRGAYSGDAIGYGSTEALAIESLERRALVVRNAHLIGQLAERDTEIARLVERIACLGDAHNDAEDALRVGTARIEYLERVVYAVAPRERIAAILAVARDMDSGRAA
jgi:hypothetical protein